MGRNTNNPVTTHRMRGGGWGPVRSGQTPARLMAIPEDPSPDYYNFPGADCATDQVFAVPTFGERTLYDAHINRNDNVIAPLQILIDLGASFSSNWRPLAHDWVACYASYNRASDQPSSAMAPPIPFLASMCSIRTYRNCTAFK